MKKLIALFAVVVLMTSFAFANPVPTSGVTGSATVSLKCPTPMASVTLSPATQDVTAGNTAAGTWDASATHWYGATPKVTITATGHTMIQTFPIELTGTSSGCDKSWAKVSTDGTWSFTTGVTESEGDITVSMTLDF